MEFDHFLSKYMHNFDLVASIVHFCLLVPDYPSLPRAPLGLAVANCLEASRTEVVPPAF